MTAQVFNFREGFPSGVLLGQLSFVLKGSTL